jgi:hypothetical protein
MLDEAVNAGWGPRRSCELRYMVVQRRWNCHHYWMRKTYFRKRDSKGQFLPNKGLENDKNISVNEARREGFTPPTNDALVAKRPVDMPNQGFLNPR